MQANHISISQLSVPKKQAFNTSSWQKSGKISPSIRFGALNDVDQALLNMLKGMHEVNKYSGDHVEGDRLVRESLNTLAEMAEAKPAENKSALELANQLYRTYIANIIGSLNPSVTIGLEAVLPKLLNFAEGKYVVDSDIAQAPIRFYLKETKRYVDLFYQRLAE